MHESLRSPLSIKDFALAEQSPQPHRNRLFVYAKAPRTNHWHPIAERAVPQIESAGPDCVVEIDGQDTPAASSA